ncbi:hypothetical protein FDZ58_00995 [Ehrlichia ruminantium]|uniref:MotE family protein n=1 Tax=Ehrlichia ruminantium TaxID=779 RepID=UPI0007A023A8|nr:hypothetical protein [Ehrlichia ruminantium]KYW96921.1 hypothetical protein AUR40_01090 [Ehrlichia ruminantium]QLK50255.1 hypothetical protein FDZ68_00995 [Ehrlichia ruminantium]QLK51180.1 hypothetical protein FDZ66_01000 [Ehrlichia ruminantium]QLK53014.1 hypothetical protein FDZ64_00995 [Ehrlichia ruminantium]QLK58516.1 hypothetical protein FDZ58_00995 [Ehrlichia ruminantium]
MQVVYIVNIILVFCIGGVLFPYLYYTNSSKVAKFYVFDNAKFVQDQDNDVVLDSLTKKVKLLQINGESVSVIDLEKSYNNLLKQKKELEDKELKLKAIEQHNKDQALRLEKIKEDIVKLITLDIQDNLQKIRGIAAIYQNMPIDLAVKIFELSDMNTLLLIVSYLDEATLSRILSHVNKSIAEKIRKVSTEMSIKCNCSNTSLLS